MNLAAHIALGGLPNFFSTPRASTNLNPPLITLLFVKYPRVENLIFVRIKDDRVLLVIVYFIRFLGIKTPCSSPPSRKADFVTHVGQIRARSFCLALEFVTYHGWRVADTNFSPVNNYFFQGTTTWCANVVYEFTQGEGNENARSRMKRGLVIASAENPARTRYENEERA